MPDCDRCDAEDLTTWITLRNPYYDDGTIQRLVSRMVVCEDCREEMEASDGWDL